MKPENYQIFMWIFAVCWLLASIAAMSSWKKWQAAKQKIYELENAKPKKQESKERIAVYNEGSKLNYMICSFVIMPDGSLYLYGDDRAVVAYFKPHVWDWLEGDPVPKVEEVLPPEKTQP